MVADDKRRASLATYTIGLLMEWERGECAPTKYHVVWLPHVPSRRVTRKQIVRIVKQRWRTERAHEDLTGKLGLDHFEGIGSAAGITTSPSPWRV